MCQGEGAVTYHLTVQDVTNVMTAVTFILFSLDSQTSTNQGMH